MIQRARTTSEPVVVRARPFLRRLCVGKDCRNTSGLGSVILAASSDQTCVVLLAQEVPASRSCACGVFVLCFSMRLTSAYVWACAPRALKDIGRAVSWRLVIICRCTRDVSSSAASLVPIMCGSCPSLSAWLQTAKGNPGLLRGVHTSLLTDCL